MERLLIGTKLEFGLKLEDNNAMGQEQKSGSTYPGVPESLLRERFGDMGARDKLGESSLPGVWNVVRDRNKPPITICGKDENGTDYTYTADAFVTGARLEREKREASGQNA